MRKVVITGIGAVTPAGMDEQTIFNNILNKNSFIDTIDRFDTSDYFVQAAGQVANLDAKRSFPYRMIKKSDRFTHMALLAIKSALENANLDLADTNRDRVGVNVGNMLGGWEFAERELGGLWRDGVEFLSPYQATAWFSASPQGYGCIHFGIKGPCRTFIADRVSGAYSIVEGAKLIQRNKADVMICGGTEAPLAPFALMSMQKSSFLTSCNKENAETAYRPYDEQHSGMVIGEGSSFLILEDEEHAIKRGAKILARIDGWSLTNDGYYPYDTVRPDGKVLARTIRESLSMANLSPKDIDCIIPNASGIPVEDDTDLYAIENAFGDYAANVPISTQKPAIGHLLGAAVSTDVVMGLIMMKEGKIPPVANLDKVPDKFEKFNFVKDSAIEGECNNIMILSRGLGGANSSIIVSKYV